MTCIVAIKGNDGKVYMGGDSATLKGYDISVSAPKVYILEDKFAMGVSGYSRTAQILKNLLTPPRHNVEYDDDMKYLVGDFTKEIRRLLKEHGMLKVEDQKDDVEGSILLGYRGEIYSFSANLSVIQAVCGYDAIGCGEDYAKGSLFSTPNILDPKERLTIALDAANTHSAGISPPYTFVEIG